MKFFDFHTHLFSHAYFDGLVRQSPEGIPHDQFLKKLMESGIELPPVDPQAHLDLLYRQLDESGVDRFVSFASSPDEIPVLAGLLPANPRVTGFALFNPAGEGAEDQLDLLKQDGFSGLVLFPVLHRYFPQDPALNPVWRKIEALGFLITIHFGILKIRLRDIAGLPRTFGGQFSNPINLIEVADRHPSIRFIIPHFGGGYFRETLMLGANSANIYVDTSSSNTWIDYQESDLTLSAVFRKTRHVFGSRRILFGTDTGILPRGFRADIQEEQLKAMAGAGFTREDIHRVVYHNALELTGIVEPVITPVHEN
ncbi:MAG: amidohydrolase family protein [Bacteroidetes bacterium]|nr:amidohydrolase family protein [Bacteroidota bacterium]